MSTKATKKELLSIRITEKEKTKLRRLSAQYPGGLSELVRTLVFQEVARLEMAQRVEGGCNG